MYSKTLENKILLRQCKIIILVNIYNNEANFLAFDYCPRYKKLFILLVVPFIIQLHFYFKLQSQFCSLLYFFLKYLSSFTRYFFKQCYFTFFILNIPNAINNIILKNNIYKDILLSTLK